MGISPTALFLKMHTHVAIEGHRTACLKLTPHKCVGSKPKEEVQNWTLQEQWLRDSKRNCLKNYIKSAMLNASSLLWKISSFTSAISWVAQAFCVPGKKRKDILTALTIHALGFMHYINSFDADWVLYFIKWHKYLNMIMLDLYSLVL